MKFDNKKTVITVSILFLVIVLLVSLLINNTVKEGFPEKPTQGAGSSNVIVDPSNKEKIPVRNDKSLCKGNTLTWKDASNYSKYPEEMTRYVNNKDLNWLLFDGFDPTDIKSKEEKLWHCTGPSAKNGQRNDSFYYKTSGCPKDLVKVDFNGAFLCVNPSSQSPNIPTNCSGYDSTTNSWYYGWTDPKNGIFYSCKSNTNSYQPSLVCPGNLKNNNGVCM